MNVRFGYLQSSSAIIGFKKNDRDYLLGLNPNYLMDSIKFTENNRVSVVTKTNDNGEGNVIIVPIYNVATDGKSLLTKLVATLPVNCVGAVPTKVYDVL